MIETDVDLGNGRTLHAYDSGEGRLAVVWHHGTPNIGAPPAPLFEAAERLGIRWLSYDRPAYGGSTPEPGRTPASAASWATAVADAAGIDRFAMMGHSGGSTHALAAAALLGDRVSGLLAISALAPFDAEGLDWFAGMSAAGEGSLRAATEGRAAKERYEATSEEDDPGFTDADNAMFSGPWSWFLTVVRPALTGGPGGLIDDDLAYVSPWGCDPAAVTAPVLLLHGGEDRVAPVAHASWLAGRIPAAELRVGAGDGHISILNSAGPALEWLATRSA